MGSRIPWQVWGCKRPVYKRLDDPQRWLFQLLSCPEAVALATAGSRKTDEIDEALWKHKRPAGKPLPVLHRRLKTKAPDPSCDARVTCTFPPPPPNCRVLPSPPNLEDPFLAKCLAQPSPPSAWCPGSGVDSDCWSQGPSAFCECSAGKLG